LYFIVVIAAQTETGEADAHPLAKWLRTCSEASTWDKEDTDGVKDGRERLHGPFASTCTQ
jgi:hypothetical protein